LKSEMKEAPDRLPSDLRQREGNTVDKLSIDILLSKIKDLHKRVVEQEGELGSERLRNEALQTKLEVLIECYRAMDEDLARGRHKIKGSTVIRDAEKDGGATIRPSYMRLALTCADLRCRLAQLEKGRELNQPSSDREQIIKEKSTEVEQGIEEDAQYDEERVITDTSSLVEYLKKASFKLRRARYYGMELHSRLIAAYQPK
jgi:hypothetical protein